MNEDSLLIGHRMLSEISNRNLTVSEVGAKSGIGEQTILNIMNGNEPDVSLSLIKQFCFTLNMSVKSFFDFEPYNQKD
ncbi:helix-turn-helix domain-containing protein [uncultured Secundilactobacillus sp.]|uniref:helix-turn-helix domain-containing protein n=1 Tax=uncultured Secundilactobacillus sp. TaxID=2813935 RepID=UPI002587E72A|nr:helix-turn-helix transcriptional regulator [uncultured Secundilactobacillus sp.]